MHNAIHHNIPSPSFPVATLFVATSIISRRTLIEILSGVVCSSRFQSVVAFFESDFILTVHVSLLYLWLIPMGFDAYHTPFGVVRWLAIVFGFVGGDAMWTLYFRCCTCTVI